MSILIIDPGALEKIKLVEGGSDFENYSNGEKKEFEETFTKFLSKFRECKTNNFAGQSELLELCYADGGRALYGVGGWNRYFVRIPNGELLYSLLHDRSPLSIDEIKKIGFDIF